MEERLDIFTRNGEYLGIRTRAECHDPNPGFYHKAAWTWAYNSKGEVLVQKRSMKKKKFPGYWDMTCAGHIDAGESVIKGAIREAKEEIGVTLNENDLEFMFEYIDDNAWELGQVFFFKLDTNIEELELQEEEVEKVKWMKLDDFKELFNSDKWVPADNKYKELVINELKRRIYNKRRESL